MGLKEKLKEHEEGFDKVKQNREKQQFKQFEDDYNKQKKETKAKIEKGDDLISYNSREFEGYNTPHSLARIAAIQYIRLERPSYFAKKQLAENIIEFKQILEEKGLAKEHQVYKDLEQLAGETLESSKRGAEEEDGLDDYKAVIEKLGEAYS